MAHIRQILANLSISVAEFKKNPKTVIKAVKSEPIAVIVNDRPAFYCVPADILESLYSKFYEMNEIQNIQDFASNDGCVGNVNDDDESFGVQDIFQSIEDEQATQLPSDEDIVDPISNSVADPLDEEIRNQSGSSIDHHLFNSTAKIIEDNTSSVNDPFADIGVSGDDFPAMDDFSTDDMSAIDDTMLPRVDDDSFNNVAPGQKAPIRTACLNPSADADSKASASANLTDTALKISTPQVDTSALPAQLTDCPDVRSLVSGPHSYSLDHVAKTYSPYKHKKVQAKLIAEQKKELKKEHKARKKEIKKLEKAAKTLKAGKSLDKEQLMLPETELVNMLATSKKASVDKCKSAKINCSSNSKCATTKENAAQESSQVSKSASVQKTSSTARSPRAKASTTSAATPKKPAAKKAVSSKETAAKKAVSSKETAAKDAQALETKTATKSKAPTTTAAKTRAATATKTKAATSTKAKTAAAKTKSATATKDKTATATKAAPKSSTTVKAAREIAAETHVPEPAEGSKRAKKANEFILPTKEKAVD